MALANVSLKQFIADMFRVIVPFWSALPEVGRKLYFTVIINVMAPWFSRPCRSLRDTEFPKVLRCQLKVELEI